MRLLVTADVHLNPDHPERLEALREVVGKSREHDVDHLLVAGDLFDRAADVEELKSEVRELFSDNSFHTFVIPGNHDADSYRDEDYFGDDVDVLHEPPVEVVDAEGLRLVAVPYTDSGFDELVPEIRDSLHPEHVNALLVHGTLSTEIGGYGGENRYLPFTPEELLETGVDVVFAGHVHSEPRKQEFGDRELEFVYPGSPVSITRGETGRRRAWLYDTETESFSSLSLSTHHYLVEDVSVVPGREDSELDALDRRLEAREIEDAEVVVDATGYVEGGPEEFYRRVERRLEEVGAEQFHVDRGGVENASAAVESDLYREFERKLDERDADGVDAEQVRRIVLRAMSRMERA